MRKELMKLLLPDHWRDENMSERKSKSIRSGRSILAANGEALELSHALCVSRASRSQPDRQFARTSLGSSQIAAMH